MDLLPRTGDDFERIYGPLGYDYAAIQRERQRFEIRRQGAPVFVCAYVPMSVRLYETVCLFVCVCLCVRLSCCSFFLDSVLGRTIHRTFMLAHERTCLCSNVMLRAELLDIVRQERRSITRDLIGGFHGTDVP